MVPRAAYPPGAERSDLPHLDIAVDGFVDTGYPCTTPGADGHRTVTAAPGGVVSVGGYRFAMRDVEGLLRA